MRRRRQSKSRSEVVHASPLLPLAVPPETLERVEKSEALLAEAQIELQALLSELKGKDVSN